MKQSQRPLRLSLSQVDQRLAPLLEGWLQVEEQMLRDQAVLDSFLASHLDKPGARPVDSQTS